MDPEFLWRILSGSGPRVGSGGRPGPASATPGTGCQQRPSVCAGLAATGRPRRERRYLSADHFREAEPQRVERWK